jgi:glycosyltransferase involved in cell wall biosynthesis
MTTVRLVTTPLVENQYFNEILAGLSAKQIEVVREDRPGFKTPWIPQGTETLVSLALRLSSSHAERAQKGGNDKEPIRKYRSGFLPATPPALIFGRAELAFEWDIDQLTENDVTLAFITDDAFYYSGSLARIVARCARLLVRHAADQALLARLFGPAIWAKSVLLDADFHLVPPPEAAAQSPHEDHLLRQLQRAVDGHPTCLEAFWSSANSKYRWIVPSPDRRLIPAFSQAWQAGKIPMTWGDHFDGQWLQRSGLGLWSPSASDVCKAVESDLANGVTLPLPKAFALRWTQAFDGSMRAKADTGHTAKKPIHQILPTIVFGDAVSNHALFVQSVLRSFGHASEIFAHQVGPGLESNASKYHPDKLKHAPAVIYHHAVGCDLAEHCAAHQGPKALIYHNVTPPEFFAPWEPHVAAVTAHGRSQIPLIAQSFAVSRGDSQYNANELLANGSTTAKAMWLPVDPARWALQADHDWLTKLNDGRTNILFVGRLAPNKCQHDLLDLLAELKRYREAPRLILVGGGTHGERYLAFIKNRIQLLGLRDDVFITGHVNEAQAMACYLSSSAYVSMSEHEGFGVPLVEAMWFDLPVMAFAAAAVPEVLGNAGLLFTEKNFPEIAAALHALCSPGPMREKVITSQQQRRQLFTLAKIIPKIALLAAELEQAS